MSGRTRTESPHLTGHYPRRRLSLLLRGCIEATQPFVVDNTNVTTAERSPYIAAAKAAGFRVTGYYFASPLRDCLRRNAERDLRRRVPAKGIVGTYKRMQIPALGEGVDALHCVRIDEAGQFIVEELASGSC